MLTILLLLVVVEVLLVVVGLEDLEPIFLDTH
jgi:hypothetical protein